MNYTGLDNYKDPISRSDRELNVLYEVICAMRATLELNHILYIILTGVTSHLGLGYNRGILFLVNNKTNSLECKMAISPESGEHANKIWTNIEKSHHDMDDLIQTETFNKEIDRSQLYKSLRELKLPLSDQRDTLLTYAFKKGLPLHLNPGDIIQYADDPLFDYFKTDELIVMPLRAKGTINGLIVADNIFTKKPISDADIKIFSMLADQAGLAIENSRLYEMVVHKSHTDSITNLWNHGFFQEKLTEEIKTAEKLHSPLSLAMLDIDDFKKLNDMYGHQHGDVILREVAQILRDSSRDADYVCRYGGEEFTLILKQTSKEQSIEIAERLRKKISSHPFPSTSEDHKLRVTVSIGLASYPDDAITKKELIANADRAMYIAKFSGKNKTCVADANT